MSRISLRGPFLWLWSAWMLALYFTVLQLAWTWYAHGFQAIDPVATRVLLLAWAFLPLELAGAVFNRLRRDRPEIARTFSQWMQFAAHRTPGHLWWRGWNGFVTANAVIVGFVVGLSTYPLFAGLIWATTGMLLPWLGLVMALCVGALTFWWNFHHWQQRERYG